MSLQITERLIAKKTLEAQVIIGILLARNEPLEARLNQSPPQFLAPSLT